MGTPAMLFGALASSAIASCTAFVLSLLVLSRISVFLETWKQASLAQHEDAWLRNQCRAPEFFARMQHHFPTLCSRVEGAPPMTPFQAALNAAIARPSALELACGNSGCLEALAGEWRRGMDQTAAAAGNDETGSSGDLVKRYTALAFAWLLLFHAFLWLARRILERIPLDRRRWRSPQAQPSHPLLQLRTRTGRKPAPPPLVVVPTFRGMDI